MVRITHTFGIRLGRASVRWGWWYLFLALDGNLEYWASAALYCEQFLPGLAGKAYTNIAIELRTLLLTSI